MGANFGRIKDEWRTNEPPALELQVDQARAWGLVPPGLGVSGK